MIGESGKSKQGVVYRYYKCGGRKRKHNCSKRTERKEWIENVVIDFTLNILLTPKNIDAIATRVIELAEQEYNDHTIVKSLRSQLKDVESRISNLLTAIEQGILTSTTKERLTTLEQEKESLNEQILREESRKPFLTKDHVVFWLSSFKERKVDNPNVQQQIVDTLLNSVYVYDTDDPKKKKFIINYNASTNTSYTITRSDISETTPFSHAMP